MHSKRLLLTLSVFLTLIVLLAACVQTPPLPAPDEDVRSVVRDLNVPGTLRASTLLVQSAVDLPNGSLSWNDLARMPGLYTVLENASAYTIPDSTVGPVIYTNNGATDTITLTLPTFFATGSQYCVFVQDAYTITVSPDPSDLILALTDAIGDSIQNTGTIGSNLCIVAIDDDNWAPIGQVGTWSDITEEGGGPQ